MEFADITGYPVGTSASIRAAIDASVLVNGVFLRCYLKEISGAKKTFKILK